MVTVPAGVLAFALRIGRMLRLTVHGPEQVGFLRYRPVLANDALKRDFGFTPARTTAEAFDEYLATHPGVARAESVAASVAPPRPPVARERR